MLEIRFEHPILAFVTMQYGVFEVGVGGFVYTLFTMIIAYRQ